MKLLAKSLVLSVVLGMGAAGYFGLKYMAPETPQTGQIELTLPATEEAIAQYKKQQTIEKTQWKTELKQLELSVAQKPLSLQKQREQLIQVADMETFSQQHLALNKPIELLPSTDRLLDPAYDKVASEDAATKRQTEAWRSVMQNVSEATGVSTQSLEKLFQ